MAVYKKTYRPFDGALTSTFSRLFVIPRFAFEDLKKSRFLTIFFFASFIYPLIAALFIYVRHNASALNLLGVQGADRLITINTTFFLNFLGWQSMMALFMASFIGPGLVSPDLANNALSLYLARPFSRVEYVLGKMWVLIILMSCMTWVPGLLLFFLQSYLEEGWTWMNQNANLAWGLFFYVACGVAQAHEGQRRDWSIHPAIVELDTTENIYALGDIHGDYKRLVKLLVAGRLLAEVDRTHRLLPYQGPGTPRVLGLSAAVRVFVLREVMTKLARAEARASRRRPAAHRSYPTAHRRSAQFPWSLPEGMHSSRPQDDARAPDR
jgi:hypothetical protein